MTEPLCLKTSLYTHRFHFSSFRAAYKEPGRCFPSKGCSKHLETLQSDLHHLLHYQHAGLQRCPEHPPLHLDLPCPGFLSSTISLWHSIYLLLLLYAKASKLWTHCRLFWAQQCMLQACNHLYKQNRPSFLCWPQCSFGSEMYPKDPYRRSWLKWFKCPWKANGACKSPWIPEGACKSQPGRLWGHDPEPLINYVPLDFLKSRVTC